MSHMVMAQPTVIDPTSGLPAVAIGVIGTGGMGLRHVENLQNHVVGARVVAIHDVDGERAARAAATAAGARTFAGPLALIQDPGVQAVVIASPDSTHAELAVACIDAGKPVLCEKPLGVSAAQAQAVVEAEVAAGRRLISVGFMRRYDPAHVAVKRAVDAGAIGQPLLFKGASRAQTMASDRPLDNIMSNSAIHDLDAARWMLADVQDDVHEVMVHALRSRDVFAPETADLFLITMRFGARKLASIEVAMAVEYGYDIEATLVGTQGVAETQQPDVALVRRNNQRGFTYPMDWLERFQTAYLAEVEEWVCALRGVRPFTGATAWDGLMANLVADACVQSVRSGAPARIAAPDMPALYR
jgi:myo-inositol 2-dehydrogenase/D-chiro-inositol 1-dehydrogenase